jgi:hypothetical protein
MSGYISSVGTANLCLAKVFIIIIFFYFIYNYKLYKFFKAAWSEYDGGWGGVPGGDWAKLS